jgi:hypothetical protein|tara:strand:+ start:42 stop:827 length:786 start_codon:yes stop_codon:yes gene_type:complete
MIVEILENQFRDTLFDEKGQIDHLAPLFERTGIPCPKVDEVQLTREGGFNLFLNEYNAVLRFYPRALYLYKHADVDEHIIMNEHLYHARILPYIGCVNFENFTMQLMPGVALCDEFCHSITLRQEFNSAFSDDIDCINANVGYKSPLERNFETATLLDTVCATRFPQKHNNYLARKQDSILENFADYDDLQKAFYDCWTNDNAEAMQTFWAQLRQEADQDNRLYSGWLEESIKTLQNVNMTKHWFIEKSRAYHQRTFENAP